MPHRGAARARQLHEQGISVVTRSSPAVSRSGAVVRGAGYAAGYFGFRLSKDLAGVFRAGAASGLALGDLGMGLAGRQRPYDRAQAPCLR